jgi:hypothetical protein
METVKHRRDYSLWPGYQDCHRAVGDDNLSNDALGLMTLDRGLAPLSLKLSPHCM